MFRSIIFALSLFASSFSIACQYTDNESELNDALQDREKMKEYALSLAEKSDRIFIASILDKGENYLVFDDIVNIKNKTETGTKLTWTTPEEIIVGCTGLTSMKQLRLPGERYRTEGYRMDVLVYSNNGEILRMNLVDSFASPPSGYEEIEWIKR